MKKKVLALMLSIVFIFAAIGFVGTPQLQAEEEKPELDILTWYTTFNMQEDPAYDVVEEVTGYKVNWYNLPQTNADEKLFLEIGGGAEYDLLVNIGIANLVQLGNQGALLPIKDLLEEEGQNLLDSLSPLGKDTATNEDGEMFFIPSESFDGPAAGGDPYGIIKGGLGFNMNYVEDYGYDTLPTNPDEFYELLKKHTDETGNPALTISKTPWVGEIMSGFNMGASTWQKIDGEYVHRLRNPNLPAYLDYIKQLFAEGIIDNDMPINERPDIREKFTNGTALTTPLMFWDIDGINSAFEATGMEPNVKVMTPLHPVDGQGILNYNSGVSFGFAIPRSAKNPEHAIRYLNTIAEPENFERIYLGVEGESFEIKDDQYYPIFPDFNDYNNSDKFVGPFDSTLKFQMWQARARKTEAMAEMYDDMNSKIDEYEVVPFYEGYASLVPEISEGNLALGTLLNDLLIQAVVETEEDTQEQIDNIIEEWEATGGLEYEEAYRQWFEDNQDLVEQGVKD